MNVLRAVVCVCLLVTAGAVAAQSTSECPSLPASSGLQWQALAQRDFILCKATAADGREVLSLTLSARNPELPLNRALRQEKAASPVKRCTGTSPTWVDRNRRAMTPAGSP